ncbi:hypothetical protein AVEN_117968-1 [Araneus ventricosus]|uniref:Uncharacterized protein n=1 Tax=Araneus ventricosus TaxID=182803 RepID=A0A4Y2H821_ARAVE|nr:hypothetical protein AVEN_117968-1 [Araneus ventricosus]
MLSLTVVIFFICSSFIKCNYYPSNPQVPFGYRPQFQTNDPVWSQFWDIYDYSGPLEQEPVDSGVPHPEDLFFQTRLPQVEDDAYNRYREYFYRRYGTNFVDY